MYNAKFTFEFAPGTGAKGIIQFTIVLDAPDKFKAEKIAILMACSQLKNLNEVDLLYFNVVKNEQQ
jgi:hypothetical protein